MRRAFSAAFNREQAIDIAQISAIPMMHFTPPAMFGAPPVDQVGIDGAGIGYDPDFGRSEMVAAGYPDCDGLPPIDILLTPTFNYGMVFIQAIETELGCEADVFTVKPMDFADLSDAVWSGTSEGLPNMWIYGWAPDYSDAHNFLFDINMHCETWNWSRAACTAWDDLVREAQYEIDPTRRRELYYQAEEMMFGYEGEFRMIPLYMPVTPLLVKSWVDYPVDTDGIIGGQHFDWVTIDQVAQLAARGG